MEGRCAPHVLLITEEEACVFKLKSSAVPVVPFLTTKKLQPKETGIPVEEKRRQKRHGWPCNQAAHSIRRHAVSIGKWTLTMIHMFWGPE
uniref:Uncharacterized protein n=1 Tax=Chromera velia CCMP2878 TaxID=1169474 RepID=A0A0G4FLK8_9ALVE|eukprot:Cvel_394.t1-p1 / transcript=Cvel_394.t1 / gene=Cvel_394 / organism=Chromera_velia_CCMP2878 / gene_product=hypothetical protein / transcript_product=hypothetical protein / location=Cvel_scaffold13:6453-7111(+) / protein_length=89 / sequence_SO=supercontig / SO=protein_coding / is_pseudo=false